MTCTGAFDCPRTPGEDGRCWWHAAAVLDVPLKTPTGVEHHVTDPYLHPTGWGSAGHIGAWSELAW